METDSDFLLFIQNHSKYFKKYDNIDSIEKSPICGWLYIFTAYCYDGDITKVLPEFTDKFGKTLRELFERVTQYKDEVNIKNIEAIHCTLPCERERLVKAFLKMRTSIKPIFGKEYFVNYRNLIKVLMLIVIYISDEDIIRYEASYSNYKFDKNDTDFNILFDKIDEHINKIKENNEVELKIEENICTIIPNNEYVCEFCNKDFSTDYILENHKKTAKFCLKIQIENQNSKIDNIFENAFLKCEYCDKIFNINKDLTIHYTTCEFKKRQTKYELKSLIKYKDKILQELKEKIKTLNILLKIERNTINDLKEENTIYKNYFLKNKDKIDDDSIDFLLN